jgi:hypothetical protein
MKLVGIMCIGTYYSPWFPYTVASIYHVCDQIVVVNGGYDINNPKDDVYNVPLEKVAEDIKDLDINGKIVQVRDTTNDGPHRLKNLKTQVQMDNDHDSNAYDIRGFNMSLANTRAMDLGADWILKIDTDQAVYNDARRIKDHMDSWTFNQYEFCLDIRHLSVPGPTTPYHDSVFTYRPDRADFYNGGGSPAVVHDDRKGTEEFHAAHLRQANPDDITEDEKFQHFRNRAAFSLFTNKYGRWCDELFREAETMANFRMNDGFWKKPSDVPPPEATQIRRDELRNWLS